jgi:HSP20 family molecular chaperone IbpA
MASYDDGVLTLRIPVKETAKARRIPVEAREAHRRIAA